MIRFQVVWSLSTVLCSNQYNYNYNNNYNYNYNYNYYYGDGFE
jgi:hypothetical protein